MIARLVRRMRSKHPGSVVYLGSRCFVLFLFFRLYTRRHHPVEQKGATVQEEAGHSDPPTSEEEEDGSINPRNGRPDQV